GPQCRKPALPGKYAEERSGAVQDLLLIEHSRRFWTSNLWTVYSRGLWAPTVLFWRRDDADEFLSRSKDFLKTTCSYSCTTSCRNSRLGRRQALEEQALSAMGCKRGSSDSHRFPLGAGNDDSAYMASRFRERGCTRTPDQRWCETNAASG